MAISDTQKIDDLYKKIVFGVTKTDVAGNKSPSNEAIASPLLVRGDQLWNQSGDIPSTPPVSTSGVVQVRTGTAKVAASTDPTVVPATRTWITGVANWIPAQFGSSYTVKVYADSIGASNPQLTGTLLAPDGINSDAWIFDYQAGVLNFADTNIPAALTGKTLYVVGYTYTGSMGVNNNASIGDLVVTGATIGTSVTDGNVTLDANGTGSVVLASPVTITGAATLESTLNVSSTVTAPSFAGNITSTGLSTFANVDINSGLIDGTVIGATTRAAGSFTTVTGGTATFASINNTPIGNAVPSTGAFTTLDASGNVGFTGTQESTLTNNGALVIAGGVGIAKNLNVGGNVIVTGNLTVQGSTTTVNSTDVSTVDKNITVASGALNAAQADGAGLTVAGGNATFTYDGGNNTWNVNKTFNIPTVKVSDATQATNPTSGSLQTLGGAGVELDLWVGGTIHGNISTPNLQATGGSATGMTTIGTTNFSSGNAVITGGSVGGTASINVTNGTIANMTSSNVLITGGSISGTAIDVTSFTSSNVQITGGNITGLTNLGSTNGTVTNFVSSNVAITGGTESGVTITNSPISGATGNFTTMTTADAVITGGNVTGINTLGATNGTVTNLGSSNVNVTGGMIAGSTTVDVTNGTVDNLTTGNLQATGGSATGLLDLQATNFASGNVTITGGTVTALSTLGATNGTVTNLTSGNAHITGGVITTTPISGSTGNFTVMTTVDAEITGGNVTGIGSLGATNGTVTNLTTGNAQVTGGAVTGLSTLGATTGTVTNFISGNVAITGGFATGLSTLGATTSSATNFSTGNAIITGGNITATPVGVGGAAAGAFTTLSAANGITGNLVTAVQTAITQVGTLSGLDVVGNVGVTGATTFTGNVVVPTTYSISIADQPTADTQAANKAYVDSKVNGMTWKAPIQAANMIGEASSIPGSPASRAAYVVLDAAASGVWAGLAGHFVQWDGTQWNDLGTVGTTNRFGISFTIAATATAPFTGKDDYVAQVTGGNSTTGYTYSFIAPTLYDTMMNDNQATVGFGRTFTYTKDSVWVESGGVISIVAGTALSYNVNTMNVDMDNSTIGVNGSDQLTVLKSPNISGGAAGSVPYQTGGNVTALLPAGTTSQVLISGASPSWTNTPTLTGTNFTGVPNGALINSNVVIGSTTVNLGSTVATFAGLTSVTSTNFYGTLTGNVVATNLTGTLLTAAQPNVTSVGTLSGLTVTAPIVGNILGSAATVTAAAQPAITSVGTLTGLTAGNIVVTGETSTGSLVTANAQVTGGLIAGSTSVDITNGTIDNFISGNIAVTGGTATGLSTVGATNGTVTNFTSGNVKITGGTIDGTPFSGSTVSASSVTTADAQVTGGSITGLTTFSITNGTVTNLSSSNAQVTGGNIVNTPVGQGGGAAAGTFTTLTATTSITGTLATAAQPNVTSLGTLTGLTAGNVTVTGNTGTGSLTTANAQITGGEITGMGNVAATYGNFTNLVAGSMSSASINNTPIGNAIPSTGAFTTLGSNNLVRFTDLTESYTPADGSVVISGGVGIAKNLNVGGNVVIEGNLEVNGTLTTVNSNTVDVVDKNITIAKGALTDSAANHAGITVDGPAAAEIYYNQPTQTWNLNLPTVASEFRGNVVGTNLTGTLLTAAQPNVTSVGTLSSLTVTAATNTGSLVTSNAVITGGSVAGSASINVTNGTITNMSSSNVAITGGSISSTAGSFTTLAASTSLNATTSGTITLSSGTLGTMNNVTIGGTTRAAAYFTDVTGGLATFAAINNTVIGNTSPNVATFTTMNSSEVDTTDVYTVGIIATGTSALNVVNANTVTINTSLSANASTFNSTLTANGAATFNSTAIFNNQVTMSPAAGTVTINPVTAGTIANMAVTATTLTSSQVALTGGYMDGTTIGANVPAAGYFSTLSGGSFSASSINNTPVGNATPSTGAFTTLSATSGITGNLVTAWQPNVTLLGTLTSLTVSGETNTNSLVTANARVTGGNISNTPIGTGGASSGAFTTLSATAGITGNIVTAVQTGITTVGSLGNLTVLGNSTTNGTLTGGTVSTTNAQITGGSITLTPISGSTVSATVLTTSNAQVTGGNISNTPIGLLGAAAGYFTTLSGDNGTITNLSTGNAQITGGNISGVAITSSNGTFNTLSGIDTSATNFTTANAHITGGNIDGTAIGDTTKSSGKFTTLSASGGANIGGGRLLANINIESTNTTSGTIQVVGGVGVTGNIHVGNGAFINDNNSVQPTIVMGVNDQSLIYASSTTNQVLIGGNVVSSGSFVPGAKFQVNSTDSMILPKGTSGQRPTTGTEVAGMTRFNTTFNVLEYWNGSVWSSADTVFTLITDQQFTGDGLQKNFTLSAPSTTNATIVSINGVVQIPGLAYSVATSTLQFDEAPLTTDIIDVRVLVTTQTLSGMSSPNGFNQIIPDDTDISFWTGTSSSIQRWKISATTGALLPVGAGIDIGSPTDIVDNIYASNVVISGGSISGISFTLSSIDNTSIGNAVPSTGSFTTLSTNTKLALTSDAPITFNGAATGFGTSATVVDSFAKATYRAAKYVVSVANGTDFQVAEVLVTHDGTYAYSTMYGVVSSTGSTFASFAAIVNGANVELKATGTSAGNTVKVQKIYIAV